MRGLALLLSAVLLGACSTAEPNAPPDPGLGTRDALIDYVARLGFVGHDSPLNDGRQRWLGRHDPEGSLVEAIGPPAALTDVSMTIFLTGDATKLGQWAAAFLDKYAPGSRSFLTMVSTAAMDADQDQTRTFGDRRVRIQTVDFAHQGGLTALVTLVQ